MNNLYGFGADGHGIVDDQTYTFDCYNKGKISTWAYLRNLHMTSTQLMIGGIRITLLDKRETTTQEYNWH